MTPLGRSHGSRVKPGMTEADVLRFNLESDLSSYLLFKQKMVFAQ